MIQTSSLSTQRDIAMNINDDCEQGDINFLPKMRTITPNNTSNRNKKINYNNMALAYSMG